MEYDVSSELQFSCVEGLTICQSRDGRQTGGGVQNWIGLKVEFVLPEICWGALWGAFCGIVASGVSQWDATSCLKLALVFVLADPLIGNLCRLLFDLSWAVDDREERCKESRDAHVRRLPYTKEGSPGYRVGQWLKQAGSWWRDVFWPQAGWLLSGVVFASGGMLILGSVLGPPVGWLVLLSFGVIGLGLLVRPYSGDLAIVFRALTEVGVPLLVGYLIFAPLAPEALAMAAVFTLIYGASLRLSISGMGKVAWLIPLALAGLLGLLAGTCRPLPVAILGLILVFPVWLSWYASAKQATARWYLHTVRFYVLGSMFLSALSLGLT